MKDIFWLMKKILSVTFRKKRNIIMYFGLPLVGIFISFLAYGNSGPQILKVGIEDKDHGAIAHDTIHFLEQLNNVRVKTVTESNMKEKLTSGTIDCAVILDKGFSEGIQSGNPAEIQMISIKGAEITGFVKSYLYQYLGNIVSIGKTANGDASAFEKMYGTYQQSQFKVSAENVKDTSQSKGMTNQTIGFLLMIMLLSAGNFAEIILKEKENRTYFRLLSTPISARKYVLSNIGVNLMVMIAQVIFTLILMTKVFHIEMHVAFWQMAVILLLFALVAIGLSLMIVSFAGNSSAAGALQNLVSTPSCLLAGCFWPVEIMPKAVQKIADFMPQHWTLDTINQLQQGSHFGSLYLHFMILLAFALAFFLIATYRFGKNNSVRNFV